MKKVKKKAREKFKLDIYIAKMLLMLVVPGLLFACIFILGFCIGLWEGEKRQISAGQLGQSTEEVFNKKEL